MIERLLPEMPPQLKGVDFVYDKIDNVLYASALSEKQTDFFVVAFQKALGVAPLPLTPKTLALKQTGADVNDWSPVSFSPDVEDEKSMLDPGPGFLDVVMVFIRAGSRAADEAGPGRVKSGFS